MRGQSATGGPHDSLTVVIVPSADTGQRLLGVVREWYAAGLLTSAVWVRPEDIHLAPGRAPDVTAQHFGDWGVRTADLFEILGRHRRELVRVVQAQVLDGPGSIDELQLDMAAQVRDWIHESLPRAITGSGGAKGTEVRAINLITGATGLAEMPSQLVSVDWDVNAVTSPEDRPDPERANRFVRPGTNLVPVAVLSTASVAGLFPGTDVAPFDAVTGDSSVVFGKALVVRPTVRALLGERSIKGLALLCANEALGSGSPAVSNPNRFVAGEPDQIIEPLLDWLDTTDGASLTPSPHDDEPHDQGRSVTIMRGLSTFAWFVGRALVTMGWSLWRQVVKSTESLATRMIVGDASGIRLTLKPDVGDDLAEDVAALEKQDIERSRAELREMERRPVRMPTHRLWSDLREVVHGVLDGGSLPHGAPRQLEGSRRVLLGTPGHVVPRPDDEHQVAEGAIPGLDPQRIPACSPEHAARVRQHLEGVLAEARNSVSAAEAELAGLGSPPEDESKRKAHAQAVAKAQRRLSDAAAEVRRLETVERSLHEWLSRREGSLLWRLTERASDRRSEASSQEANARELAVTSAGLDETRPMTLRRTFLIRAWVVVGMTALLLIPMNWGRLDGSSSESWWSSLLVVLVAAAVLLLVIRSWYHGILAFLHAYERGADQRARGAQQFERANADRRRFDEITRQLGQWTAILGWTLHAPWQPPADETDEVAVLLDESVRPAALVLAEPALDEADEAEIARFAVRELAGAGWRARAYRRLVASHVSDTREVQDDTLLAALDRIDRDDGRGAPDRQRFLSDLESGRPQARATNEVVDDAEGFLRSARLYKDSMWVRPLEASTSPGMPVEDVAFLLQALVPASPLARETWSDAALVEGAHERLTTHYWTRHHPDWDVAERVSPGTISDAAIQHTPLLDIAVRVDVSEWLDVGSLRLFGKAPAGEPTEWFGSSGSDDVFT